MKYLAEVWIRTPEADDPTSDAPPYREGSREFSTFAAARAWVARSEGGNVCTVDEDGNETILWTGP